MAFSDDGTKVVAFDQEGRDHQVNVFPGGDAELVNELRKHNVQFAVVPPPEANPAFQLLSGFGGLLINFLPLFLLIGLNIMASRGGPGGPARPVRSPGPLRSPLYLDTGSLTDTYCVCWIGPCHRYVDTYVPTRVASVAFLRPSARWRGCRVRA